MLEPENDNNNINTLYLVINHLFGHIEKIEGSSDRYLVVNINNKKIIFLMKYGNMEIRTTADGIWKLVEEKFIFDNENNKIK